MQKPKTGRVHSALFTLVIRNKNKQTKRNRKATEFYLESFQLQRNVRIKRDEDFTQEETGSGFALQGWKQGYNK